MGKRGGGKWEQEGKDLGRGSLEGLLGDIQAKVLVMSASSGAYSQHRTLTFMVS